MTGKIKFDTNPKDIEVYINGSFAGFTPLDITDCNPGQYSYRLKYSESSQMTGELIVYPGKITHLLYDFVLNSLYKEYEEYEEIESKTESETKSLESEQQLQQSQPSVIENLNSSVLQILQPTDIKINGMQEMQEMQKMQETQDTSCTSPEPNIALCSIAQPNLEISQVEEQPPTSQPPTSSEDLTSIGKKLDDISTLLQDISKNMGLLAQYMSQSLGYDEERHNLASIQLPISTSVPNIPESVDILACDDATTLPQKTTGFLGYDRIPIYQLLKGRRAPVLTFTNDGSTNLFVRIGYSYDLWNTSETLVSRGEVKTFLNVYELRVRGPVLGNLDPSIGQQPGGIYRISEYESKFNTYNLNKPAIFVNTITNVPQVGAGFAFVTLIGDIINLQSVFRSSVENTDPVIYYTYQGADLTFSTRSQLGALTIGDKLEPNGTRGETIYFAAKHFAAQIIEVTTDTDLQ